MRDCKFCGCTAVVKNGRVRGNQRYLCKDCGKNQIARDKPIRYGNKEKSMAISYMYLNNIGFRAIGRVMKISFQHIHGWIRKASELARESN